MDNNHNAVKSPLHYTEGRKFEPKDVIRDWGLNFNLGSSLKYIARAGRKDDTIQDLKKAQEYLQFEIDAIEAERGKAKEDKLDALRYAVKENLHAEPLSGVSVISVEVPKGTPPEEIIQQVIKHIYGGGLE